MNYHGLAMITIVASIGLLMTAMISTGFSSVSAAKQDNPNGFGKGASELGKSGQMGEHASEQDEPRLGIGNVGNAICGEKLKPGELAGVLNGGGCP
ncbi:hypothetical protein NMY3_03698 [Candidatus Nitrosocosmicus oleophilus]|uniref:Uncharacterized protein n=1 Tax=Candidatus Nitrosocosmicus oleophilus TaxID=1353260 RepID=A0A654M443_9ARCH|nr:hypothetical protein [Candidatus Nitrosocosmicus oleophilus]ALI37880.1 hypothetical protein NMY3_03698 [Candidatus Nitrosocosmicus oleophilus]